MKKTISILFLFVFVYNMAGFLIVFKVEQYAGKSAMKEYVKNNIANSELEKVVISNAAIASTTSGFRYLDNNEEFYYNGRLYDIARSGSDGVNTVFYCINDKNEERILANIDEHFQRNTDQNLPGKSQSSKLIKGMIKDYIPQKQSTLHKLTGTNILFQDSHQYFIEQYISVFTPPPKS
jgi:hypothetical protein